MSMFYYTIELDDESKEPATIVTPYGTFQYSHLPLGLSIVVDEAKAIIKEVLQEEGTDAYLNDVERDFLGHWLTPVGVKLGGERVEAVLQMQVPKT
eukprot:14486847-Ditylum_brightwellii.AAC.1